MQNTIAEIKSQLRKGDIATVAAIVGCSYDLVWRMLNYPEGDKNYRNPDSELGKKILNAFKLIQKTRAHLKSLHSKPLKKSA